MIRNIARALCAASLVIAPIALSSPAQAATACTVNGIPVTSSNVTGTPGSDFIQCSTVNSGDTVNGLGGNDYIVTGSVAGTVRGGSGSDYIQTNSVSPTGQVLGESESDFIRTGFNLGVVNGGTGIDVCRVAGGNPPVNCEA
ncbi:hypothetical protein ACFVTY_20450 [Streptomyces sp. NPDC058067]|uniref:hypothetical protein n=1 Tax=Streptomyces sp. NPDC058067 TaxID=3346324 RepID=UPI0036E6A960